MRQAKIDLSIGQVNGPVDPPPIQITVKLGRHKVVRVTIPPADFALCLTGRLIQADAELWSVDEISPGQTHLGRMTKS
jgi:hypothetical protein